MTISVGNKPNKNQTGKDLNAKFNNGFKATNINLFKNIKKYTIMKM